MTTRVNIQLNDPSGDPIAGALILAKLSAPMIVASVIATESVQATTDHDGTAFLPLYPNTGGTSYTFEITLPNVVRPIVYRGIIVPDVAAITLSELLGWISPAANSIHYLTGSLYMTGSFYWG